MNQRLKGGIVFLVLGIAFTAGGAYPVYDYQQTVDSAEPLDGEVVSSDAERISSPSEENIEYYVNVTYRFTYDGTEYTRSEVFPDGRNGELSRSRAESIAENHPPGEKTTVYVVAGNPQDTYLIQNGIAWWYYLLPVFGLLVSFAGILNVVQGMRGVGPTVSDD